MFRIFLCLNFLLIGLSASGGDPEGSAETITYVLSTKFLRGCGDQSTVPEGGYKVTVTKYDSADEGMPDEDTAPAKLAKEYKTNARPTVTGREADGKATMSPFAIDINLDEILARMAAPETFSRFTTEQLLPVIFTDKVAFGRTPMFRVCATLALRPEAEPAVPRRLANFFLDQTGGVPVDDANPLQRIINFRTAELLLLRALEAGDSEAMLPLGKLLFSQKRWAELIALHTLYADRHETLLWGAEYFIRAYRKLAAFTGVFGEADPALKELSHAYYEAFHQVLMSAASDAPDVVRIELARMWHTEKGEIFHLKPPFDRCLDTLLPRTLFEE